MQVFVIHLRFTTRSNKAFALVGDGREADDHTDFKPGSTLTALAVVVHAHFYYARAVILVSYVTITDRNYGQK